MTLFTEQLFSNFIQVTATRTVARRDNGPDFNRLRNIFRLIGLTNDSAKCYEPLIRSDFYLAIGRDRSSFTRAHPRFVR